jgi:hypothetical protein
MMQQAGAGKIELIARIFAETGVKELFNGIFHLLQKYQDKPRVVRVRGKYTSIDPREWKNNYDIMTNVGLGTGSKDQQMAMAAMVLQKQEQILQTQGYANPLVSVGQYRNTLGRFIEASGYKDSAEFFKEISPELDAQLSQPQQPQQQPNPALDMMMQQAQAQIETDRAKAINEIEIAKAKAQASIQLEREKAAANLELKTAEFQAEAQLKAAQVGARLTGDVRIPG